MRKAKGQFYDSPFTRIAQFLLDQGIHPNHATFVQVPFFGIQVWAAVTGQPWLFVAMILVVMALDGADGVLARTGNMQSRTGAVLDSTFDTIGIAVVMWGAAQFYPFAETWLFALFLGNALLYLQNAVLEEKMISYLRGPIILAVAWPEFLLGALVLATFLVSWLLIARIPRTFKALGELD